MKKLVTLKKLNHCLLIGVVAALFIGCSGGTSGATDDTTLNTYTGIVGDVEIPTVVVIMNWTDYAETDPSIWYDKIFNTAANSVNQWFNETTTGNLQLVPITENSGTANDGIIMVNMGVAHPGSDSDPDPIVQLAKQTAWRNTYITAAVKTALDAASVTVENSADFAALDINSDGALDRRELNIIFIVAGGESSFGDPTASSIWAHAWCFDSGSTLTIDGKYVMKYNLNDTLSGWYGRFGANHGAHKATIGVIAHEIGHSLLALGDYYDPFNTSSGLAWYDIMSGGSWAYKSGDLYPGETPTQYTAYNRADSFLDVNVTSLSASADVTIKCSSKEVIKLVTTKTNEYFLVECRDTAKANSEISLNLPDTTFTEDRLFMMTYHVDTLKTNNSEDGVQTSTNHYKVALVEKNTATLLTSTANLASDFSDVYVLGDLAIPTSKTNLYDGNVTNYTIKVIDENTTDRTMTISVTK